MRFVRRLAPESPLIPRTEELRAGSSSCPLAAARLRRLGPTNGPDNYASLGQVFRNAQLRIKIS